MPPSTAIRSKRIAAHAVISVAGDCEPAPPVNRTPPPLIDVPPASVDVRPEGAFVVSSKRACHVSSTLVPFVVSVTTPEELAAVTGIFVSALIAATIAAATFVTVIDAPTVTDTARPLTR